MLDRFLSFHVVNIKTSLVDSLLWSILFFICIFICSPVSFTIKDRIIPMMTIAIPK